MNKTLKQTIEKSDEEFIEAGAVLEHDRWARWQKYMHRKGSVVLGENNEEIAFQIPIEQWLWWKKEIDTPYSELTEEQKESDRKETREYLPLLHSRDTAILEAYKEELRGEIEKMIDEENNSGAYNRSATRIAHFNEVIEIINKETKV